MPPTRDATSIAVVVGHNLRRIRDERGLTLSQLATRSGVSKGTLSKVESAATNATVDTLDALARALDVPVATLLSSEPRSDVVVVRHDQGMPFGDTSVSEARLVSTVARSGLNVEVHDMTLEPGHRVSSATHGTGSWEHVLVLTGEIELGPVDAPARLGPGDYIAYRADQPHTWTAVGDGPARIWVTLVARTPSS